MISAKDLKNVDLAVANSGYVTKDVDKLLNEAANTIEAYQRENKELYHKLEVLASKIEEYRSEEDAIKTALVTAQKMADKIKKESKDAAALLRRTSCVAVLEDVVNPTNLGAIFRSAAALGVEAVLLTPNCTDPLYRRAIRVSMGNVFLVPWAYLPDDHWQALLKEGGFQTVAMALREDARVLWDPALSRISKLAVVMGSEGPGLKPETIAACDYTVTVPMTNGVDSLNVAAASAVAFYQLALLRQKNR